MGISNFVALKEIVASYDTASLDAVVQAINIKLSLSVEADNKAASQQRHAASHRQKAESHRLDAALILVDLRQRVEADGHSWWKWQEGKFTRSRKDIEKLLRMAKAEKPEVAAETERTQTRGRVRAHRTLERTVRSKKKKDAPLSGPIQEDCAGCRTDEERWHHSLGSFAGDAVSIRDFWKREFSEWEKYKVPSSLVTLAKQAAKAWEDLAAELEVQADRTGSAGNCLP